MTSVMRSSPSGAITGCGSPRSWTTSQIPHTVRPTLVVEPKTGDGRSAGPAVPTLAVWLALRGLANRGAEGPQVAGSGSASAAPEHRVRHGPERDPAAFHQRVG